MVALADVFRLGYFADDFIFLNAVGRPQEASAEILKAAELEPLSVLIHRDVAWHPFFQRRYAEAAAQLRRTLALVPRYAPARSLLGRVLIEDGKAEEGLRELHGVAPDLPRSTAAALLAYGEAAAGRRARAAGLLGELAAIATREYVSPYSVALVHARLGRSSDALGWLEKAFAEQDTTMVNLRADPRWDPLRDHPRFKALVARMGFPPSRGGERALTSLHHEDKRKGEPPWQRSS